MNKWHDIIRERLREYRGESKACLYPPAGYEWGCGNRKQIQKTIDLVSKIVNGIPAEAWPKKDALYPLHVASSGWTMRLGWEKNQRTVDLAYRNDDHTAWCIERGGRFVNFDIGGS